MGNHCKTKKLSDCRLRLNHDQTTSVRGHARYFGVVHVLALGNGQMFHGGENSRVRNLSRAEGEVVVSVSQTRKQYIVATFACVHRGPRYGRFPITVVVQRAARVGTNLQFPRQQVVVLAKQWVVRALWMFYAQRLCNVLFLFGQALCKVARTIRVAGGTLFVKGKPFRNNGTSDRSIDRLGRRRPPLRDG